MTIPTPPRRRWFIPDPKDLIWAVALLSIGFGANWLMASGLISFDIPMLKRAEFAIMSAVALCAWAIIGAGFGAIFKRKVLGAAIVAIAIGSIMIAVYFV